MHSHPSSAAASALWRRILSLPAALGAAVVFTTFAAGGGAYAASRSDAPAAGMAAVPGAAYTPAAGVSWGRAVEVPGLAALNKGSQAGVESVSCPSAGDCAAGGRYAGRHGNDPAFVVSERHGRWGKAIEVPGLAALNTGPGADVESVSCPSAGNCAAGGWYYTPAGRHAAPEQGFVVSERNGAWGKAIEVPSLAALNPGGEAEVDSVSCASPGNCVAGGSYGGSVKRQGFVAVERHGRWGKAAEVPGLGTLNTFNYAEVYSVSCAPSGLCAAGGYYTARDGNASGFVAVERDGRWGRAVEVPGLGALSTGGDAVVDSVSCPSAGNCAAGGTYTDRSHNSQGFAAVERDGRWRKAIEVPGLGALNKGGFAVVSSVSCASAGDCAAGGDYADSEGKSQGFVAVERDGRWGTATEVPGLAVLGKGRNAQVLSVSCAPGGPCAAGGYYSGRVGYHSYFVAVEQDGRWSRAIQVPGLKTLHKGRVSGIDEFYLSVSCARGGTCAAGGYYADGPGNSQGFVTQAR